MGPLAFILVGGLLYLQVDGKLFEMLAYFTYIHADFLLEFIFLNHDHVTWS